MGAALLMVTACTGDDGDVQSDDGPEAPDAIDASVTGEDDAPHLKVTFDVVADAEAYLLDFGDDTEPIRIEPAECVDDTCEVALDRLSVAGASSFTVASVAGEYVSEPSQTVDVPSWPDPPEPAPTELPDDEPVELVVARIDEDGKPTFDTESVPAGDDVEARVAELEEQDDVVGVSIAAPVSQQAGSDQGDEPVGDEPTGDEAQDGAQGAGSPDFPAGMATWQQEALNYGGLPEDPRGSGVTVAVIDDGIYPSHSSIARADVTETNVVEPGRDDAPGDHATAVTSMIVGEHNGLVPGIAIGATIRAYDVRNEEGESSGTLEHFTEAIVQAVDDGADVINISQAAWCNLRGRIGQGCPDEVLQPALDYAEEQGVFVVASAGNDGGSEDECPASASGRNKDNWPAAAPTVIAVGGTTRGGGEYQCSPDKNYIDVLAPADKLRTAASPEGYAIVSGTSLAAPLISGLIAALLAENPDFTPAELRNYLKYATDENGRILPGALMHQLDIVPPEDEIIDLTTGREWIPFSVGLYFPEDSDVWVKAGRAFVPDPENFLDHDDSYPGDSVRTGWDYLDSYTVLIGGLLVIDEHNEVSGFGGMQLTGHDSSYTVECPEFSPQTPTFAFRWDVPVVVSGKLSDDEGGGSRHGELTLSLGKNATPDSNGTIPDLRITEDTFDECADLIAERDTMFTDPEYPWSEVQTWPERNVELGEELYEQIINESPFRIDDGFFPPVESEEDDEPVYSSSGTIDDGVGFRLRVGDVNFTQLD
ncbi:hypothetical protein EF847_08345 [Actinobacteria bacterium YIM 96077]|uniref:Peptidase S8/S53 domain-containing protein n=1 Tax=Phytoactinopolyspora halophila TaxID=1981511 RepID=A0A329QVZ8_9ACTN|nr:S8/S53 family peptidase [Phytoactinopolyspora halophila]AYY12721.1 hypothetical protein EF847_08345 [Actinobacteria bacterium YIM 96077]RAW16485.1 hypothetical protein DPM12_07675 [Phytoactinopolyspora halophila]